MQEQPTALRVDDPGVRALCRAADAGARVPLCVAAALALRLRLAQPQAGGGVRLLPPALVRRMVPVLSRGAGNRLTCC